MTNRNILLPLLFLLIGLMVNPLDSFAQRKGSPKGKQQEHKAQHKKAQHKKAHHKKAQHKKAHQKQAAHHHYKHLPRRNAVVTTLPKGVIVMKHKGGKIHHHNGIFYKSIDGVSFAVARAPIGLKIKRIPPGHRKIVVRKKAYVYYYGTFYTKTPNSDEYEVVKAPIGAEVDAIPDGYEVEEIDGVAYYTLDDVRYMEKDSSGEPVYEVVK